MRTRFFPLTDPKEIMDRHALIAQEFHFAVDDEMLISRFMQLSEIAYSRSEAKKDAAREGKVYVG
jgi:hypothetical protein